MNCLKLVCATRVVNRHSKRSFRAYAMFDKYEKQKQNQKVKNSTGFSLYNNKPY